MGAIQTMMDEHQTILRVLASLEALITREPEEPVSTFRDAVQFLRDYADRLHHGKEEDLLFPAMEASGIPAEQGPTAVMRIEHDEGRALVRRMADLAEVGDAEFDRAAFSVPARSFIDLLRAHIGKEDHILYPMAGRLMRGSDLAQLDAACAQADAKNFDADMPEKWNQWARELAGRLGVDRERFEVSPACH
jgi:hemerythrin-like domain-containing protein